MQFFQTLSIELHEDKSIAGNVVRPEHPDHELKRSVHADVSINGKDVRLVQFSHAYCMVVHDDVSIIGNDVRLVQLEKPLLIWVQFEVSSPVIVVNDVHPRNVSNSEVNPVESLIEKVTKLVMSRKV